MYLISIISHPDAMLAIGLGLLIVIILIQLTIHGNQLAIEHRLDEVDKLRRSNMHVMKEFLSLKHDLAKHKKDKLTVLKSKEPQ